MEDTSTKGEKRMQKTRKAIIAGIIAATVLLIVIGVITVVALASPTRRAERQMDVAGKYLDDMEYEQAIAEYEKVIELDPNLEDAYVKIAKIYVALGDYDAAVDILEQGYDETGTKRLKRKLETMEELRTEARRGDSEEESPPVETIEISTPTSEAAATATSAAETEAPVTLDVISIDKGERGPVITYQVDGVTKVIEVECSTGGYDPVYVLGFGWQQGDLTGDGIDELVVSIYIENNLVEYGQDTYIYALEDGELKELLYVDPNIYLDHSFLICDARIEDGELWLEGAYKVYSETENVTTVEEGTIRYQDGVWVKVYY